MKQDELAQIKFYVEAAVSKSYFTAMKHVAGVGDEVEQHERNTVFLRKLLFKAQKHIQNLEEN